MIRIVLIRFSILYPGRSFSDQPNSSTDLPAKPGKYSKRCRIQSLGHNQINVLAGLGKLPESLWQEICQPPGQTNRFGDTFLV